MDIIIFLRSLDTTEKECIIRGQDMAAPMDAGSAFLKLVEKFNSSSGYLIFNRFSV